MKRASLVAGSQDLGWVGWVVGFGFVRKDFFTQCTVFFSFLFVPVIMGCNLLIVKHVL